MSGLEQKYGTNAFAAPAVSPSPVADARCPPNARCPLCSLSWHLFDRPPGADLARRQHMLYGDTPAQANRLPDAR